MREFSYLIVTLLLVAVFTSASNNYSKDSRIGTTAPNFTIGNNENVVTLSQFRGKYVLLNIWSSADANARLDNMMLNKLVQDNDKIEQLAVNFDRSRALFNEVITADSLYTTGQYYCEPQDRAAFMKKWGVDDKHYCTFLIDTKGVVIALNPNEDEIEKALK